MTPIEYRSERRVDRTALRLLGREVLRGAHDRARLGHVRGTGAGDPEVGDLGAALVVDHHVLRLEVAVHDPALVREASAAQDLHREVDRDRLGSSGPRSRTTSLSVRPVDVLHRDVVGAVPLAAVVDADDVRVLQPGGGRRLAAEALDELRVLGEAAVQQLERDRRPSCWSSAQVDVGHAAGAEPLDDPVAAVDERVARRRSRIYRSRVT